MFLKSLKRQDVKNVIEGKGAADRIPMLLHFWIYPEEFGDSKWKVLEILEKYPQDVQTICFNQPSIFESPEDDPEYRWMNIDDPYKGQAVGYDNKVAIQDWSMLDDIISKFPDANYKKMIIENPLKDGRYRLGVWWYALFERQWQYRGMENSLMDPYVYPEQTHKLLAAMTDFYCKVMERAKKELQLDGFFFSDDIGMQTGPFFKMETFREFYKPYYENLINKAHELGMHFWLHSCGNVEGFIPEFIDLGLDVLHPIQKHTMNEESIAEKFGNDICIWAGFDVQQTIPWGSVEDIRKEVRFLFDTFYRPEGRLVFGAGNCINGDCPLESLEALFDEAFSYCPVL